MSTLTRLALAVALGAAPAASIAAEPPVEIPVVLPLTGNSAYDGQQGKATMDALEASTNRDGGIRGRPLKFVYYDDQSTPQVAVQLTEVALRSNPPVVLGSFPSANCLAMAPITKGKAVQYCFSPGIHPAFGADLFSSGIGTDSQALAMLRYAREHGWKRIAALVVTTSSGLDGEEQLKVAVALPENATKGMKLVGVEHFNPTDQTASAQIERLRALDPQALVLWGAGQQFGTALRAYSDAGLTIPVFTSDAVLSYQLMKQFGTIVPKEIYFAGPIFLAGPNGSGIDRRVRDAIGKLYAAGTRAGFTVDLNSGNAWDPPSLVIDALRHVGPTANASSVHDWILAQKSWAGASGLYDFSNPAAPQRGLTVQNATIYRWNGGTQHFDAISKPGGLP